MRVRSFTMFGVVWFVLAGVFFAFSPQKARALDFTITLEDVAAKSDVIQSLLNTLTAHHVPEVYAFVAGGKVDQSPQTLSVLSAWVEAGYPLGNLTYNKTDLNDVESSEFIADIERNEFFLRELSRGMHFRFLRYPRGHEGNTRDKRQAVRDYLSRTSYAVAHVTVETDDLLWNDAFARCQVMGNASAQAEVIQLFVDHLNRRIIHSRRLARQLFDRDVKYILRIHASSFAVAAMPRVLELIETEFSGDHVGGPARYVGLTEAMRDPIFVLDPGVVSARHMTFLEQIVASRGVEAPARPGIPERLGQMCR